MRHRFIPSLSLVATLGLALSACQDASSASPPTSSTASTPAPVTSVAGLTRITDPSLVCMVNDQNMGRPQIPVEVDGDVYYGCCEGCKLRLRQDPTIRTAQDPVTDEPVDKAKAVIAQDRQGNILYFASESTFQAYTPSH